MLKLRPFDRFLLAFCLLLLALICLVSFLVGTGLMQGIFIQLFNTSMAHWYNRVALCVLALIFLGCAVRVLIQISPPYDAPAVETVTLKTTENGQIRMSLDALDTLVQKSVRGNAAVRDVKSQETVGEQGEVKISLELSLAQDAVVPEVCLSIQQAVRDYVQQKAGLTVAQVEVCVYQVGSGALARVE